MENNNVILSSLSMDLKRIALAYHRGSYKTAERFSTETKRWIGMIDIRSVPLYIKKHLTNIEGSIRNHDKIKAAEDLLMYSTILQNYTLCSEIDPSSEK